MLLQGLKYKTVLSLLLVSQILLLGGVSNSQAANLCAPALAAKTNAPAHDENIHELFTHLSDLAEQISPNKIPFKFGFESEYTMTQLNGLVTVYGPHASLGINAEQWFQMPVETRVTWVKDHISDLFPEKRLAGKLVKLVNSAELSFLPTSLILDSTKNVEIVVAPADSLEIWKRQVELINQKFGNGSMQGTVGLPTHQFFGDHQSLLQANIGFLNVINEMDTLSKLKIGYERWVKDQSKEVALSFKHPFLGPMTRMKQQHLIEYLRNNSVGKMFEPETLKLVSGSDISFKYIGGTAYRPDIAGPFYTVLEIRDTHNNYEALLDRMVRNLTFLKIGRSDFEKASFLNAFESSKDFEKFPENVRTMLKKIFPPKVEENADYTAEERLAVEVFRNFAYPLRDWTGHLQFLGVMNLAPTIEAAQKAYVQKLVSFANKPQLTPEQQAVLVQGALVEFAHESQIGHLFQDWLKRTVQNHIDQMTEQKQEQHTPHYKRAG